ncbi:hypothetical protein BASA50_001355 [Batrachochytrium salamandrivorans]|uniref:G-protein coupled receptors family 1 profile domain-containing protein n=1 Tax=Batrachochytrium salamandrivorans TaxID=1357716 RepID=A0ABQ8EY11_9FUNG|nr:hypothetical protein BASA62_003491 [Batrachochytrium salamandrivorans]KAH6582954.1 hypothetical protein BASA60_001677 [Batrachochytrium salamandrivorans]KAH6583589.1 hypothetical protein BASA61_007920 [Batrachochytrium salamandrivorans]KAH6587222.1 hypothetical protein BASA50_001355 [Batrachochytrium salamandrivorans]
MAMPYLYLGLVLNLASVLLSLALSSRYLLRAITAKRRSSLGWSLLLVNVTALITNISEGIFVYAWPAIPVGVFRTWCWLLSGLQLNLLTFEIMRVYTIVLKLELLYGHIRLLKLIAVSIHVVLNCVVYISCITFLEPNVVKIATMISGVYILIVSLCSTMMNVTIVSSFHRRFHRTSHSTSIQSTHSVSKPIAVPISTSQISAVTTEQKQEKKYLRLLALVSSTLVLSIGSVSCLILLQYSIPSNQNYEVNIALMHLRQVSTGLFGLYISAQTYLFEVIKRTHENDVIGIQGRNAFSNLSASFVAESTGVATNVARTLESQVLREQRRVTTEESRRIRRSSSLDLSPRISQWATGLAITDENGGLDLSVRVSDIAFSPLPINDPYAMNTPPIELGQSQSKISSLQLATLAIAQNGSLGQSAMADSLIYRPLHETTLELLPPMLLGSMGERTHFGIEAASLNNQLRYTTRRSRSTSCGSRTHPRFNTEPSPLGISYDHSQSKKKLSNTSRPTQIR